MSCVERSHECMRPPVPHGDGNRRGEHSENMHHLDRRPSDSCVRAPEEQRHGPDETELPPVDGDDNEQSSELVHLE